MSNLTPLLGNWRTASRRYDENPPNSNDSNEIPVVYGSRSSQTVPDDTRSGGALDPSPFFDGGAISGLLSISGFPALPLARQPTLVLGNGMGRGLNPRPRQIFQGQTNWQIPRAQDHNSRSSEDDQQNALKKLKKQIYNPTPKQLARRLSLHYRDGAANVLKELEKLKEEEAKRCSVCLEDFEPRTEVMLTPCNHMFHEDCILPWLKSQGHCPVCRFKIYEPSRASQTYFNDSNFGNVVATDVLGDGFVSVLTALEEAIRLNR